MNQPIEADGSVLIAPGEGRDLRTGSRIANSDDEVSTEALKPSWKPRPESHASTYRTEVRRHAIAEVGTGPG